MSDSTEEAAEKKVVEVEIVESAPADFSPLLEAKAEEGVLPIRIIQPGWGSSGYYPSDVLKKAAEEGIFDNAHMHWDHIATGERPERSLDRMTGTVIEGSVEHRSDGVYGNAYVFPHWLGAVESMRDHIGLSIVGKGKAAYGEAEGKQGPIFESLEIKDVDFVTRAGAGGKIIKRFAEAQEQPPAPTSPEPTEESESNVPTASEAPAADLSAIEAMIKQSFGDAEAKIEERLSQIEAAANRSVALSEAREYLADSDLPQVAKQRVMQAVEADPNTENVGKQVREAVEAELKYIESVTPVHLRAPSAPVADINNFEESLDKALSFLDFGEEEQE